MTEDSMELHLRQQRLWLWVDARGSMILLTDYTTERELTEAELDALGALVELAKARRQQERKT